MLIKKFLVTFLSCVLLIPCYVSNVYANDTFITLDDTAGGFVTVEDDVDFLYMEPAEERKSKIVVTNNSDMLVDFFINGEILSNIADNTDGEKGGLYEIKLYKEGEQEAFFDGIIGSDEYRKYVSGEDIGDKFLYEDKKFATLNKNESCNIILSVTLDGKSVGNSYMNTQGKLRINISATQQENTNNNIPNNGGNNTDNSSNSNKQFTGKTFVKTGDNNNVYLYITISIIAGLVVIIGIVSSFYLKHKKIKK